MEEFRVTVGTRFGRLLVDLPTLPGVDSANVGLTNLFDSRLPRMEFEDPGEMLTTAVRPTELEPMRWSGASGSYSL